MSKNFEEEYRQMIDSELPDLWDRIEAQLPKAAAAMETPEETKVNEWITSAPEEVIHEDIAVARRRKVFHSRWMPVVIAGAAALLFVIAALPVLFLSRSNEKSNESPMMNGAAEADDAGGAMDMAAAPNMYCDSEDGYYDGMPLEETAASQSDKDWQSGGSDCAVETAESLMTQDAERDTDDYAFSNDASAVVVTEMEPEEAVMNSEEAPDLYQVEVQILDHILKENGETFYEAAVLQNGENGSQKGIRVYFRCAREGEAQDDSADVSFRQREKYIVSLYGSGETLESYGIEIRDGELYGEEMYIVYEIIKN